MRKILAISFRAVFTITSLFTLLAVACTSSSENSPQLVIGGIPDQDVSLLEERFDGIANLMADELGIEVVYKPSVTYAALVAGFRQGDVGLAWFGGLTGVQARIADPGSKAIAQRPKDEKFRSAFIVSSEINGESIENLAGLSFTFGSESSTSGHLMPRFYLMEAGIDPDNDFDGRPSYSGSHDKTWKQVEAGVFQGGALNEAVWQNALDEGRIDTSKVRALTISPTYFDYHWMAGSQVDTKFGEGTVDRIQNFLTGLSSEDKKSAETLERFGTDRFIQTENGNYSAIEDTARKLGLVE